MNNEYHESILALLSASPFVHETTLSVDDRDEVWFIRTDVHFIDNSLLHFRELFVKQDNPVKKAYAYHYQRKDGRMIFRYDNAPHFPHLPTAPHHKHIGENEVVAANAPDLQSVLMEIESLIQD